MNIFTDFSRSCFIQALWLGSEILCQYLVEHPELIVGKRVLELGAGIGLCGLGALHLGASNVLMTDGDSDVLENLRYNVNLNINRANPRASLISCPQLIWGRNLDQFEKVNVMLACDCIYMTPSLKPLWETVHQLLEPDGVFIYVNVCASQAPVESVLETAISFGFAWTRTVTSQGSVFLFRWKSDGDTPAAISTQC